MLIEFEAEYVSKFDTSYVETQELYALVDNQMNSAIESINQQYNEIVQDLTIQKSKLLQEIETTSGVCNNTIKRFNQQTKFKQAKFSRYFEI